MDFSLIIPVHNEESILERNTLKMHEYLSGLPSLGSFEILLSCNGCTDRSEEIAGRLSREHPSIRHLSIKGRGLGAAIREASRAASHDAMMFYAMDLPFGLSVIGESIEEAERQEGAVVIGSKGHRDSEIQRSLLRWLFSTTISVLNNILFGLGVKDTQGSILFYREPLRKYSELMDDNGAFYQAQILIYSKAAGLRLVEIPVRLTEVRKTRFSLLQDGWRYIRSLFREKGKMMRHGIGRHG